MLEQLRETPSSSMRQFRAELRALIAGLFVLATLTFGCTTHEGHNANSTGPPGGNQNGNSNANTDSRPRSSQSATIDIKEPDRYSVAMTISVQGMGSETPAPMMTQQFGYTKLDADRRWVFAFPAPLGQIIYLEKSGLKYLVISERKQYVELTPDALGFQMSEVLTPVGAAGILNPRSQHEQLGLEPINGRTARKYRVTSASDGATQTEGIIFVDLDTGLPLRFELNVAAQENAKMRVIVEARDIQLSPDRAQFEVPVGMKKVALQEAKPQIESFATALRTFVDIILGSKPASVNSAVQSAANKNANRR